MTVPLDNAWNQAQLVVDEQEFTPWAQPGWLAHNGQSPEVAVMDFARTLVRMMNPSLVIETGVGQGYMTRSIAAALNDGCLVAFESDDEWRDMMWPLEFWRFRNNTQLSPNPMPTAEQLAAADLCVFDSDFHYRFIEITTWSEVAQPGAVALIHDTSDRDGTVHQTVRELIGDLGMTGVFLQNPRGCFMAVQPQRSE
jgi:hypothetical protein